jgi:Bacterial PH domain
MHASEPGPGEPPDHEAGRPPARPALPPLPLTWRPQRTRVVVYTVAVVVVAASVVVAVLLPREGPKAFGLADRLAFVGLGLAVVAFLHVLARPKLVADADGLTVVNLFRTRRLSWAEVVHVNLRRGDPWVFLDLDDGDTLPVMGIQASSPERAGAAVAQLRAMLAEFTRTERDD